MSNIYKAASSSPGVVFSVTGSNGVTASPTVGNVIVSGVNATTSSVGVASYNPAEFTVSGAGQVSLIGASSPVIQTINSIGPNSSGNFNLLGTSNQVSITAGTNQDTISLIGPYTPSTYTAHGVLVGEGISSIVAVGPTATTGAVLQNNSAADPSYSTASYPSTTTANQILYSSSTNVISGLATGNNGILITSATGVPSLLVGGTTGQVLTATTGSPPTWSSPAASSISITGDSGTVTGNSFNFYGNTGQADSGNTVKFKSTVSGEMDLFLTDVNDNIAIGRAAGNSSMGSANDNVGIGAGCFQHITSGQDNTSLGYISTNLLTTGSFNVAFGTNSLSGNLTSNGNTAIGYRALATATGATNTAIGYQSLTTLIAGTNNTALGLNSGFNYTGSETSNVLIQHLGVLGESNVMRLGTTGTGAGQVNQCFIAGTAGVTVSNATLMTINSSTGQTGNISAGTTGQVLTTVTTGSSPTWASPATGGTVTSVSGTANQVSVATGTTTPVISLIGPYTPSTYTAHSVIVGEGTSSMIGIGPTATTGAVLQNNSGADPTYSTASYPSSTTINQILYSSSANAVAGLSTANNGLLVTGATGVPSVTAGPGTTGNILQSNAAEAPSFSTATYPSSTTINQLLYSSASNAVGGVTAGNNGVLISGTTGVPSWLADGTTGQVLTATTGSPPSWVNPATGGTVTSVSGTANQVAVATGTTTPVISLVGPYTPATYTAHSVIVGEGTSSMVGIGPSATTGQILQNVASADPAYSTATYPSTSTINQLLYSSAANTITGLATANGGVLDTTSSGVPQIDTTNFAVLSTGLQLKGNNTNTTPPAGFIGQILSTTITYNSVALTTTTITQIGSLAITAGNWIVFGCVSFTPSVSSAITIAVAGVNIATATLTTLGIDYAELPFAALANIGIVVPPQPLSLASTTTYYLNAEAVFSTGTVGCGGKIWAVRIG